MRTERRLWGHRRLRRVPAVSVLKAMLMVAYLNRRAVRDRPLRPYELRLLRPMIRRSDSVAASRIRDIVGNRGLRRLAERPARAREQDAVHVARVVAGEALEDRAVLRVDREERHVASPRGRGHEAARHHERFLVREGDALAGPQRGERRFESGRADDAEPGVQTRESETSVVVLVPQVAKDIAGRTSEQPAGALAIEVPKSGTGPTRVMNVPNQPAEAAAGASKEPEISAIDYDAEGRAVLSGRAPGGARLFVYLDNEAIGEAVASKDGLWSFTPSTAIAPGLHVGVRRHDAFGFDLHVAPNSLLAGGGWTRSTRRGFL